MLKSVIHRLGETPQRSLRCFQLGLPIIRYIRWAYLCWFYSLDRLANGRARFIAGCIMFCGLGLYRNFG